MDSNYSDGPYNVSARFLERCSALNPYYIRAVCAIGDVVFFMGKIPAPHAALLPCNTLRL